jgi:Xaa-Pro aminopeptidase
MITIRSIILLCLLIAASSHAQTLGPEVFEARRAALMEMLDGGVAVMYGGVGDSVETGNILFVQEPNFYYLTGISEPGAALILSPGETRNQETLYLQPRNPEVEDWDGRRPSLGDALERETGFQEVSRIGRLPGDLSGMLQRSKQAVFLGPVVGSSTPMPAALQTMRDAQARIPGTSLTNMADVIPEMRRIKSDDEIALIQHAVNVTGKGIVAAMQNVEPGMSEFQLQSLVDHTYRSEGAQFLGFTTITAWGPNTTVLHYISNDQPIRDSGLLLLDTGAAWEHYSADVTRTFPANGKFTEREREIYELVLKAQNEAISKVQVGADFYKDVHLTAKGVLDDAGYGEYFIHGTGHYLGLEVHDQSDYEKPLTEGVVVTVEPGIYIPGEGIGVRIEDDILVTKDGPVILSGHIPRTVADIEKIMAQ